MDVEPLAEDLAPGDRRVAAFDWSGFTVRRVTGPDDPDFDAAFTRLWDEFGARGEMERRTAIVDRLAWDPRRPSDGHARLYEMLVVRRGDEIVAVRDHTAVVPPDGGPTVVHLSHVLVMPSQRGSGLAGWLRALPLQTARRAAAAAGRGLDAPVLLVAEMEHPDPTDVARTIRLRSYERAGFHKVDPTAAPYAQPDFRPPDVLGGDAPVSIPLALVLRRVGREDEDEMTAAELSAVIDALYGLYGVHLAAHAIAPLRDAATGWLARHSRFRLLPPTR